MTIDTAPDPADRDEHADAIATVLRASAAHYGSGESRLDDASFDLLVSLIRAYEANYPQHADPTSPDEVAGPPAGRTVAAGIEVLGQGEFAPRVAAELSAGTAGAG
ncbi:hypothetical protein [Streptomyces sp. NPDC001568]|uniref:hypothetical protein n=1 Tax=Streptomyces sp. NPDC001568 TaxID=3364588 RepID=UPI0036CCD283